MNQFSASQIAEMAAEFEGLGAQFYERASRSCGDERAARLFESLSVVGLKHRQLFSQMAARDEWKAAFYDGFVEVRAHFKFLIEGLRKNIFHLEGGRPLTIEACFSIGIFAEEKSAELYTELRRRAPEALRDGLRQIIDEEKEHLRLLSQVWLAYFKSLPKE